MTNIQSRQSSRSDDHGARTTRRGAELSPSAVVPDTGAAFSDMVATSQRRLEADSLEAAIDKSLDESRTRKRQEFLDEESDDDSDSTYLLQGGPPAQGQAAQGAIVTPSTMSSVPTRVMSEESPDWLLLASLLPAEADDGVFEVFMPNQAKLGVAVSDLPSGLSYLLMPEDDLLAKRLRGNEMELEGYLKRRTRRNVKVVVL